MKDADNANEAKERDTAISASPSALHERAEQNLQYIRELMENSSSFTGVSGKGYVLAGSTAFVAMWLAAQQQNTFDWLLVWMAELVVAGALAFGFTISKARSQGESLWSTTGKKVLFAFFPPMAVGAVLTLFLLRQNAIEWLPGVWLCVYGAAVMTAGAYSVAAIPMMGGLFLMLGSAVLFFHQTEPTIPVFGNTVLGLGMGVFHVVFGLVIWRDYGG